MTIKKLFLSLAIAFTLISSSFAEGKGSFQIHAGGGISSFLLGHGVVFNGGFIYRPANSNVHFGAESGVHIMRLDPSVVMIPFLATAYYLIPVSGSVKPYLGSSIGVMINASNSPTGSALAIYLRPGLNIPISRSMDVNVETKVGAVDAILHVIAQANLAFKL